MLTDCNYCRKNDFCKRFIFCARGGIIYYMKNFEKQIDKIADGQLKINFDLEEKLAEVLKQIKDNFPMAYEIMKDRIIFDGEYFIINKVKMTKEELIEKANDVNNYELNELNEKQIVIKKYGLLSVTPDMLYKKGNGDWCIEGKGPLNDYLEVTSGKDNNDYSNKQKKP